jgi:hypothetical protein
MFDLNLINFQELISETKSDGRFYTTPEGMVYPSVTTVLGKTKDQTHLNSWIKRIGEENAEKERRRTSTRGTNLHSLCEKFVLNQELNLREEMPDAVELFSQIKPILSKNINNILAVEAPLYSDFLGVAGRVDLVAEYDGRKSIIDFKTSNRVKEKEWIEDYFLQTAIYSVMFEERTGISIPYLVIIIGNEQSIKPSIFLERRNAWIDKAIDRINKYKELGETNA